MANSRFMSFLQAVERKVNAVPIRRMWALLIDVWLFFIFFSPIYTRIESQLYLRKIDNLLLGHIPEEAVLLSMLLWIGILLYDSVLQIDSLWLMMMWAMYVVVTGYCLKGTPGMLMMELRFRDKNGGRPKLYQLIIRHFATYISALPLFLGYIWMFFDKKHQTWHDMISGVVIVDKSE